MNYTFVPKDPDKAYVSNLLWLPKRGIRVEPVKGALEFSVQTSEGQAKIEMWEESSNHIICPREFLPPSEYPRYRFPFVDLRPRFERVEFEDLVVPRDEEQAKAWQAFAANDNGILNLGCGKGKTKLSVKKIAQRSTPTLVVVPDGGILEQWKNSILGGDRTPPGLRFDGGLGIIQGQSFDWKHPVTLALITTLTLRIRDGRIPEEMFRYFGQVIYDETHILGAPLFSLAAPYFYGDRIGLTATVQREDGLDPIFRYHIGEPFYSDLNQALIPRIYFQRTPVSFDVEDLRRNGNVNVGLLRARLGRDLVGNAFRYYVIKQALDEGRKILCLSHSVDQLRLMQTLFPGSGIIVGDTPKDERLSILRNTNPCFAIAKLGATGVDDDRLDTLFWLTPFKSRTHLQQSMGRIQRIFEGKKSPVMVVFEDDMVKSLMNLCRQLKTRLREWSFTFETCPEQRVPRELPADLVGRYQAVFNGLGKRLESEDDE